MKIQDIIFIFVFVILLILRKPKLIIASALVALILSMPLFQLKIALFTAQRLVQYATAFIVLMVILQLTALKKHT